MAATTGLFRTIVIEPISMRTGVGIGLLAVAWLWFSPPSSAQTYYQGYPCTVDCSGHEAGYEWAERKGIPDADACSGNSISFIEGCRSYFESQESGDGLDSMFDDGYADDDQED